MKVSFFTMEKHLPVMWSRPRQRAEQRQRQPIALYVYLHVSDVDNVSPWR